tara:strand:- start:2261 stop:2671 length:411 start_codon:yes stop_codon:yes gene_type:complete
MNDNLKKADMRYIYLSKKHNEILTAMIQSGVLSKKEDGIKLGVALALAFNPDGTLSADQESELSRSQNGVLNLNSADIDEDQLVTGTISLLTQDFTKNNYRRMMELAYIGLDIILNKYFDSDSNILDWSLIQKDLT